MALETVRPQGREDSLKEDVSGPLNRGGNKLATDAAPAVWALRGSPRLSRHTRGLCRCMLDAVPGGLQGQSHVECIAVAQSSADKSVRDCSQHLLIWERFQSEQDSLGVQEHPKIAPHLELRWGLSKSPWPLNPEPLNPVRASLIRTLRTCRC